MTVQGAWKEKLKRGYLPFTAAGIVAPFVLIALSGSWAASLAGGVIFLGWAAVILVSQLAIFWIPLGPRFRWRCAKVTMGSVFLVPLVLAGWAQVIHDLSA